MIYRRSYEEPIIDSSRICYQLLRLGAGVLGMMKPFSLSLSLSHLPFRAPACFRSPLVSARLRSSDRHESPAISGSGSLAFRCLFAVPIAPVAFARPNGKHTDFRIGGARRDAAFEDPPAKILIRCSFYPLGISAKADRASAPRRIIMRDVDSASQCHDIQLGDDSRCNVV